MPAPITPIRRRPLKDALVDGPILRTLLRLAWPNVIALSAGTCVVIAETSYIGRIGVEPLAAMALVFPFVILTMTMSGGAMGGGVASAIARALGAGDIERASTLASHALADRPQFWAGLHGRHADLRPKLLELLGGRGGVLANAVAYTQIFFGGAVLPWLMNSMAGILRGTGNMKLPSMVILGSAVCQIVLGGTLGLGLGPIPQFGMRGVAAGSLTAYTISIVDHVRGICFPAAPASFRRSWACESSAKCSSTSSRSASFVLLAVAVGAEHLDFTHMLARFGTAILAGYGIGSRLEFMLTSVAFSFGIASVPMIGMSIGAGRIARARQIAWIAGVISFVARRRDRTIIAMFLTLGQYVHGRSRRARGEPSISVDGGADVRLHWPGDVDVFLVAGRGQGAGPGAGANCAADVHRRRRLVAHDA